MSAKDMDPDLLEYLAEFDQILQFDYEECPSCDIDFSKYSNKYIDLATFKEPDIALRAKEFLSNDGIQVKLITNQVELKDHKVFKEEIKIQVRVFEFEKSKILLQSLKKN